MASVGLREVPLRGTEYMASFSKQGGVAQCSLAMDVVLAAREGDGC